MDELTILQAEVLKTLTEYPARLLRLTTYGLAVGCQADLVVWDTQRADEIAATLTPDTLLTDPRRRFRVCGGILYRLGPDFQLKEGRRLATMAT